jgi:glycosyltransferase involved in cell wall biosynthesis
MLKHNRKPHIALLMMVKNEEKCLQISLDSIIGFVDSMVIYDTGSTDSTIEICRKHSEKHNIPLRLTEGEFVNFSESRNVSLKFADTFKEIDYLILLDTNDELRGGENLKKFAESVKNNISTGFLTSQHWFSGKYDKYFNIRFIKAHSGWRYRGSIHEWMKNTSVEDDKYAPPVLRMPDDIILYQDRTKDDDKTGKRFIRDKVLLLEDYKENPTDPRTLFYLAQTCSCLNHLDDSFYYYKLRSQLDGFQEEKFHALLRCGEISEKLGHDWYDSCSWYMKALEHSQRAEPYVKIADHYKNINKFELSFMYVSQACNLKYPDHCILFVDAYSYNYTRWHILGVVGFYCGRLKEGYHACKMAMAAGLNKELDSKNLVFYEDKLKELKQEIPNINKVSNIDSITKAKFIQSTINELKTQSISIKKCVKIANIKWKMRKIK